jgi:hypothetical protein
VDAPGHEPRLSFLPDPYMDTDVSPDLVIDPGGGKLASLNVHKKVITLTLGKVSRTDFLLAWGPPEAKQPDPKRAKVEEAWMNWVPSVQDLGLEALRVRGPRGLPKGASARLILPPGELAAKDMVTDPDKPDEKVYLLWNFKPRKGQPFKRALANNVVYRARDIGKASLNWGTHHLAFDHTGTRQIGLSTDMVKVPVDYASGAKKLHHLMYLKGLAEPALDVRIPKLDTGTRTGHPICDQVYFVDKS